MAPKTDNVLQKPLPGFKRIHAEFCKLAEDSTNGLPYKEGASLTPADATAMKVGFDLEAKTRYWEPSDPSTRCALKEAFSDLDNLLNERTICKKKLTECHLPTIEDAYIPSTEYCRVLEHLVYTGLFQNEALLNSSGDDLFQNLQCVPVAPVNLMFQSLH